MGKLPSHDNSSITRPLLTGEFLSQYQYPLGAKHDSHIIVFSYLFALFMKIHVILSIRDSSVGGENKLSTLESCYVRKPLTSY